MEPVTLIDLLKEDRARIRNISLIGLRHNTLNRVISDRLWEGWKELAGVLPGERKCSRLAALSIWILSVSHNKNVLTESEIKNKIKEIITRFPDTILLMEDFVMPKYSKSNTAQVMNDLNSLFPTVNMIHRQRLYELGECIGSPYSSKKKLSQTSLLKMGRIAEKNVGLGCSRR